MNRLLGLFAVGLGVALHSPLVSASSPRLECSAPQSVPGRALVCDYAMLGRLNEQLADLHDEMVLSGKSGRAEWNHWLAARDACQDVDCLDRMLEASIREARLALVDVESRQPTLVLANARGIPMQVLQKTPPLPRALPAPRSRPSEPVLSLREPSRLEPLMSALTMLFLAAVAVYAVVVRRIA